MSTPHRHVEEATHVRPTKSAVPLPRPRWARASTWNRSRRRCTLTNGLSLINVSTYCQTVAMGVMNHGRRVRGSVARSL